MMLVINDLNPPAGCHISDKNWVNYGTKKMASKKAILIEKKQEYSDD